MLGLCLLVFAGVRLMFRYSLVYVCYCLAVDRLVFADVWLLLADVR